MNVSINKSKPHVPPFLQSGSTDVSSEKLHALAIGWAVSNCLKYAGKKLVINNTVSPLNRLYYYTVYNTELVNHATRKWLAVNISNFRCDSSPIVESEQPILGLLFGEHFSLEEMTAMNTTTFTRLCGEYTRLIMEDE
jgi:hypothetical protein